MTFSPTTARPMASSKIISTNVWSLPAPSDCAEPIDQPTININAPTSETLIASPKLMSCIDDKPIINSGNASEASIGACRRIWCRVSST